jgi:hypothetical protein
VAQGPEFGARRAVTSAVQDGLWLVGAHVHAVLAYQVRRAYRVTGRLDLDSLRAVWTALVTRHESLRTTLTPAPPHLNLPVDRARIADPDGAGHLVSFDGGEQIAKPLAGVCTAHLTTPFAAVLTACQASQHRYGGAERVAVSVLVPVGGAIAGFDLGGTPRCRTEDRRRVVLRGRRPFAAGTALLERIGTGSGWPRPSGNTCPTHRPRPVWSGRRQARFPVRHRQSNG